MRLLIWRPSVPDFRFLFIFNHLHAELYWFTYYGRRSFSGRIRLDRCGTVLYMTDSR
jgi:hypothetical protein